MKQLVLASTISAACATGVALAQDITIYGAMHYSTDYADSSVAIDDGDWVTGVNRASFIGVKGSEDLGNGLKAIFKIESNINGNVGSFNTYAGITGDWGTVFMGQHDSPYLISTDGLDLFADRAADYNAVIGNFAGAAVYGPTLPQIIAYVSPDMNGFSVAGALFSLDIDEGVGNDETNAVSLAATYANGPFFATLAYEDYNDGAAFLSGMGFGSSNGGNNSDNSAWKVGLGYNNEVFTLGFVYEEVDADTATIPANDAQENWMVNGSYAFGNNVVKAQYGESDSQIANGDYSYWAIGLDHSLSKRTTLYALYTELDNESAAAGTLNAGDDVGGGAHYGGTAGEDANVVSFGIMHEF